MKKEQRKLWRAVEGLPPENWASFNEAFARIKAHLGSRDLALNDLLDDIRTKRLPSADRVLPYPDATNPNLPESTAKHRVKKPVCRLLDPSYFSGCQFTEDFDRPGLVKVWFPTGLPLDGNHYFFVSRKRLDEFYPSTAPASGRPADSMAPPPRRRGPVLKHDWFSICGEIARRCIDPKTGRVQVPEKENALAEDVRDWLADHGKAKPALSEVREAVKRICAALKSSQK